MGTENEISTCMYVHDNMYKTRLSSAKVCQFQRDGHTDAYKNTAQNATPMCLTNFVQKCRGNL